MYFIKEQVYALAITLEAEDVGLHHWLAQNYSFVSFLKLVLFQHLSIQNHAGNS